MNRMQRKSVAIFATTFMIVTLLSISYTYNIYAANENANPKSGFPKDKQEGNGPPDNKGKFNKNKKSDCQDCKIKSAIIDSSVKLSYPFLGDLWQSTVGSDGKLYMQFGDATGQETSCVPADIEIGQTYPLDSNQCIITDDILLKEQFCRLNDCNNGCFTELCQYTPSGLVVMTGNPENFIQSGETIIHVPYGARTIFTNEDKVSSMFFVGDRLYAYMLYPSVTVTNGYLAYSDDQGVTWQIVEDFGFSGTSNFKTSMFIQLHDKDNFIYTLGVQHVVNADFSDLSTASPQSVYLNRVDKSSITDITAYQYFSGLVNEIPTWSSNESDAVPLDTLETIIISSVMYHQGLDRYLFLSGWDQVNFQAGLYESKTPWGQWNKVATLPTGDISSMIPKGFGDDFFYFTGANFGETGLTYNLNVGKMQLELNNNG